MPLINDHRLSVEIGDAQGRIGGCKFVGKFSGTNHGFTVVEITVFRGFGRQQAHVNRYRDSAKQGAGHQALDRAVLVVIHGGDHVALGDAALSQHFGQFNGALIQLRISKFALAQQVINGDSLGMNLGPAGNDVSNADQTTLVVTKVMRHGFLSRGILVIEMRKKHRIYARLFDSDIHIKLNLSH